MELDCLLNSLQDAGFAIERMEVEYDSGPPPQDASSEIQRWIRGTPYGVPRWWIGLSLGAAVAYVVACTLPECCKPRRLTLINPFANRRELSKQAGFDMGTQWEINPSEFACPPQLRVDLVNSRFDERIPSQHSHRLGTCLAGVDVRMIELNADHRISDEAQQLLLAQVLLSNF